MSKSADCIALVTARGGSKRLPGKNIRDLAGKPLIAWSIEAAVKARSVSRVLVSTDDAAIAAAASDAGAEIPFLRPTNLAGDKSSHYDVIAHALDWLEQDTGQLPTLLCLLQPTSPLRLAGDIDALVEMVLAANADCGFSVSEAKVHPAYMYRLNGKGEAEAFLPRPQGYLRSQDLEPLYHVNGAIYVLRPRTFRQRITVLSDRPVAYVMPPERSVDIDDAQDFILAETLMRSRLK